MTLQTVNRGPGGFWYVRQAPDSVRSYVWVDTATREQSGPCLINAALAGRPFRTPPKATVGSPKRCASRLSTITRIPTDSEGSDSVKTDYESSTSKSGRPDFGRRRFLPKRPIRADVVERKRLARSPGFPTRLQPPTPQREARVENGNIEWRTGEWPAGPTLTKEGPFLSRAERAADSRHSIAFSLPTRRPKRRLISFTPLAPSKTRATMEEIMYDQPGDKLDTYETYILDTGGQRREESRPGSRSMAAPIPYLPAPRPRASGAAS